VRRDVLTRAAELAARDEPFVLATVVRRLPASAAQAGDAAVVTAAGDFHGWLGGSCTQPVVVREALAALAEAEPRLIALSPNPAAERRPGVRVFPMTCHSGGTVDIYLEPVLPARRFLVFGHSPVALALGRAAAATGFAVEAADPHADRASYPDAARVVTDLSALSAAAGPAPVAVVATLGDGDEDAIAAALRLSPAYLGVVASAIRFGEIRERLRSRGVPDAELARIHSPAGLDIGARTPEEIAVSILAEVVAERRREKAAFPAGLPVVETEEAVDPVCGMSVAVAGARHTAAVAGRSYYFCCAGCREKFLGAPERYDPAVSAGGRA